MELMRSVIGNDRHASPVRPLCHCLNVSEETVRDAIELHDLATVRSVSQTCGAGGGCTACHRHLKRLLNENTIAKRMQQPTLSCCE